MRPIATVWRMWTDPTHFAAWYGPHGAAIPELTLAVRPGGQRLVCVEMSTPDGAHRMWFGGSHVEVVAPERLVYTEAVTDEHGRPLPPEEVGMPPGTRPSPRSPSSSARSRTSSAPAW